MSLEALGLVTKKNSCADMQSSARADRVGRLIGTNLKAGAFGRGEESSPRALRWGLVLVVVNEGVEYSLLWARSSGSVLTSGILGLAGEVLLPVRAGQTDVPLSCLQGAQSEPASSWLPSRYFAKAQLPVLTRA